jgi:hypothetical protein
MSDDLIRVKAALKKRQQEEGEEKNMSILTFRREPNQFDSRFPTEHCRDGKKVGIIRMGSLILASV